MIFSRPYKDYKYFNHFLKQIFEDITHFLVEYVFSLCTLSFLIKQDLTK